MLHPPRHRFMLQNSGRDCSHAPRHLRCVLTPQAHSTDFWQRPQSYLTPLVPRPHATGLCHRFPAEDAFLCQAPDAASSLHRLTPQISVLMSQAYYLGSLLEAAASRHNANAASSRHKLYAAGLLAVTTCLGHTPYATSPRHRFVSQISGGGRSPETQPLDFPLTPKAHTAKSPAEAAGPRHAPYAAYSCHRLMPQLYGASQVPYAVASRHRLMPQISGGGPSSTPRPLPHVPTPQTHAHAAYPMPQASCRRFFAAVPSSRATCLMQQSLRWGPHAKVPMQQSLLWVTQTHAMPFMSCPQATWHTLLNPH
eukprot:gene9139-biopygen1557